jgi:hypothetical protein
MCYQWVGRGRKVTCDNPDARSPAAAFNECDGIAERCHGIVPWDVSMLVAIIVDLTARIYSFDAPLPMARSLVVGAPTPATKFNAAPAASFNLENEIASFRGFQPRKLAISKPPSSDGE